jgi:hypothetical protein
MQSLLLLHRESHWEKAVVAESVRRELRPSGAVRELLDTEFEESAAV